MIENMSDWEILFWASVKLLSIWWPIVVFFIGYMFWETWADPYTRRAKGKSPRV